MHRRRCDRRANHEAGRDITMPAHRQPQRFPHPAGRPSRPATTPDLGYQPWRGLSAAAPVPAPKAGSSAAAASGQVPAVRGVPSRLKMSAPAAARAWPDAR